MVRLQRIRCRVAIGRAGPSFRHFAWISAKGRHDVTDIVYLRAGVVPF